MATPANLYELFLAMGTSSYAFYLTGSRYYGKERPNSDWDFFVCDPVFRTKTSSNWLIDNGFAVWSPLTTGYLDSATAVVYRHPLGVDVHVLKPQMLQNKLWARKTLKKLDVWSPCKSTMSALWDALLTSNGTTYQTKNPQLIVLLLQAKQTALFKVPK